MYVGLMEYTFKWGELRVCSARENLNLRLCKVVSEAILDHSRLILEFLGVKYGKFRPKASPPICPPTG